jgi:hypothetical protein
MVRDLIQVGNSGATGVLIFPGKRRMFLASSNSLFLIASFTLLLDQTENDVRETTQNCGDDTEDWGRIPIVAIFGDDYHLPPPLFPGAFD